MRVSMPDRVYKVTLQVEGDVERIIDAIFWDRVVNMYDVLLAEQDWPSKFVRTCPYGEDIIKPSFSPLVPEELGESYSIEWALAQAPALYRNHVGWDKESSYHVIPIKSEPQPQPHKFWTIEHTRILRELQTDMLAAQHLHTRDNKTHLVIGVIAGDIGFTYVTFNEVVSDYIEGDTFCPLYTFTQTRGDCTAQLAELKALLMALEHTDPAQPTLIVCESYYCVQSFNKYLHYWHQNGFRDSKGNTIKHRLLWGKVADLKETLPNVHDVHTLGHQRVGIHVAGNTLADEAAKSAVAVAAVAAVTRLSSKLDADTWAAVTATADGTPYPKGFPNKYHYRMGGMLNAEVKIPDIGV
ncbi:hypothetical protein NDU88_003644 [Pleurodeles waltl]|uniref:RNase H type-1 domain-containing protein n=1 Tax=Pleurodeles waltl TaxID=8319 RepID=A0AAV7LJG9_PLEWA|nr:hypothetical protein NDU88_003644 [Pleurodeles waltl]